MSLEFYRAGQRRFRGDQLKQLVQLHRESGLVLGFRHLPGFAATLDDDAMGLVTEILRLAAIGVGAEARALVDHGDLADLISDCDAAWTGQL